MVLVKGKHSKYQFLTILVGDDMGWGVAAGLLVIEQWIFLFMLCNPTF